MNLQAVPGEPSAIVSSIYKLGFYVTQLSTHGQIEFLPALPISSEQVVISFLSFLYDHQAEYDRFIIKVVGEAKRLCLLFLRKSKHCTIWKAPWTSGKIKGLGKGKVVKLRKDIFFTELISFLISFEFVPAGQGRDSLQVFSIPSLLLLGSKETTQCPLFHYPCNKQKKSFDIPKSFKETNEIRKVLSQRRQKNRLHTKGFKNILFPSVNLAAIYEAFWDHL